VDLLVTVRCESAGMRRQLDIEIGADPAVTCGALGEHLARYLRTRGVQLADGVPLVRCRPEGDTVLDPDTSVLASGVVSGDVLRVGGAPAPTTATARPIGTPLVLEVTGGPSTGLVHPLPAGRHVVGRDTGCTVGIDDPSLSARHLVIDVAPGGAPVLRPDPGATNGTFVNGDPVDGEVAVAEHDAIAAGATVFAIRPAVAERAVVRDRLGHVSFNRFPYRRPIVQRRALPDLDPPPSPPGENRFPLISLLVPLVGAVALVLVTRRSEFLLLAGLSPLMMVGNFLSEGQRSRRTYRRDRATFDAGVDRRMGELREALDGEREERFRAAPDVPLLARHAEARTERLWERPCRSPDFLEVRLGVGRRRSLISSPVRSGGDPALRAAAEERLAAADTLDLVPVTIALDEHVVAGVHGEVGAVQALGASLIVQAACLHSPEDLVIAAAVPTGQTAAWSWLGWLPHTRSLTSPLEGGHLVDETGTDDLVVRLVGVCGDRATDNGTSERPWPRVLVVLDGSVDPDRRLLATLLDAAPAGGVVVVWLGADAPSLPRQCRALIDAAPSVRDQSRLWYTDPEREPLLFEPAGLTPEVAERIARSLAPVRDASGGNAATSIPRTVSLLDALGTPTLTATEVERMWSTAAADHLVAPLGVGAEGPFAVDLVDHGPHALVAGTSGSGKSELLQTLVAGLAVRYPPDRLTFLFVDYKGGAASSVFAALPHNVGQVTNLNGAMAQRALVSLRAELQRRMAILEGRARDLSEMQRVAPDEAPPRLVIVVDEFATLVKEIPDFVAGMVDVAQRGRSLGIHLVLATQRPVGAVSENILANTNLRICLRVLDAADSTSVIGTKDAATIPGPLRGRAFVRAGPGAPIPFQCAWTGGPYRPDTSDEPVSIRGFTPFGAPVQVMAADPTPAPIAGEGGRGTQLDVARRACAGAVAALRLALPRRPWTEPLSERIELGEVLDRGDATPAEDPGRCVVLGMADDPASQSQFPATVDLEAAGGLAVFGAGGSGKTTLLRTIAAGLAREGGADAVQIHVLDFAGRSLASLAQLPQVSSVVMNDEVERTTRLLTLLELEIERRRRLLADADVDSLSALRRQRRHPVVPRTVVLLDGYPAFHGTFEQGADYQWIVALGRLATEGRSVGVHLVITANRQLGIPSALLTALTARLVLRMPSVDDLTAMGVPRSRADGVDLPDGRGFLDARTEIQVASVSADPAAVAQAAAVADLADRLRRDGVVSAPPLVGLPADLSPDDPRLIAAAGEALRPVVGLTDLSLAPARVDLTRANLVVCGPPLSGRSTVLANVAVGLRAGADPGALRLAAIGGAASPLEGAADWDISGFGRTGVAGALAETLAAVADEQGPVRLVLFVDSVEDVDAPQHAAHLEVLVRIDLVRVVAVVEPATLARSFSGWIAELKSNRSVLALQPASAADIEALCGRRAALRPGQPFPPGRGVLVDRTTASLVQIAGPVGDRPSLSAPRGCS
jgi:S-DNA-T family DNA segregation ATPase FtsK/SpoIIIE